MVGFPALGLAQQRAGISGVQQFARSSIRSPRTTAPALRWTRGVQGRRRGESAGVLVLRPAAGVRRGRAGLPARRDPGGLLRPERQDRRQAHQDRLWQSSECCTRSRSAIQATAQHLQGQAWSTGSAYARRTSARWPATMPRPVAEGKTDGHHAPRCSRNPSSRRPPSGHQVDGRCRPGRTRQDPLTGLQDVVLGRRPVAAPASRSTSSSRSTKRRPQLRNPQDRPPVVRTPVQGPSQLPG